MKKITFISEFKEFISRGNVIDLAVGIIIGSAFTAIVTSLVNQVITPAIGFLIGGLDFKDLFKIPLKAAEGKNPEVAIYFGAFIQQCINFLIIAFVVFCMVKILNRLKRKKVEVVEVKAVEPAPTAELQMLTEIRDLLKDGKTSK
jgi:large conductance mechanosensitive channel